MYILAGAFLGTLYIGVTSNLIGRLMQHRDGRFGGFTGRHGVLRLVWFEMADTMEAAIATEKRLKRWRRAWKFALIEGIKPDVERPRHRTRPATLSPPPSSRPPPPSSRPPPPSSRP